jgi:ribonuclease D
VAHDKICRRRTEGAFVTPVHYRLLAEFKDIREYVRTLQSEPALAIDLEADSLYSYPEKACLVQISTPSANTILDPLRGRDGIQALGTVLADQAIHKVFHGGDFDIRLFKREYGFEIRNVVDTMIGAQLAGRARVGLAALLEEEFDVHVEKRHQRANWSARPLAAELLRYAALDTAYLLQLWKRIRTELVQSGRLDWAEEEFSLLEAVTPSAQRAPSCFDVKGAGRLPARQLAILQALLEVREQIARSWNRPPFKVLSDQVLLRWAQSPPLNREQVLQTPRAGKGILRHLAQRILDAVHEARTLPMEECPGRSSAPYIPLTGEQKLRLKRLKKVRSDAAKRLGLGAGLLVSSKTLERLCRADPDQAPDLAASLKRWQLQVLGPALRRALLP